MQLCTCFHWSITIEQFSLIFTNVPLHIFDSTLCCNFLPLLKGMFYSLHVQNTICYRRAWDFWSKWKQWFIHLGRLSRWLSGFKWAYRIGWSVCPLSKLFYCRQYSVRESLEWDSAWTQILFRKRVWLH